MEIVKLKLSEIVESPHNPREDFDKEKLAELAADIGQRGLLQPITVRKVGKGHEVVMGARRFQASKLADLATIDAIVREMTDLEAEEAQVVENEKRDDLKPLERARGYAGLIERHGLSVDDIALKLGKARSTVYRVLKLNSLDDKAKKALAEGVIPSSTAELLAQLPPTLQGKAFGEVLAGQYNQGGPMSYREALEHLQEKYFLDLRKACFDVKADFAGLGSCAACPKRSDAQKDLFGGKKEAPLCLDSACWAKKTQQTAEAEAAKLGVPLLTAKETKDLFSHWGDIQAGAPYVRLEAPCSRDSKQRPYKLLLTATQLKELMVLAINPKHELVELLKLDGLDAALKETGKVVTEKKPGKAASSAPKTPVETPEAKAAREAKLAAFKKAYPAAVKALLAGVEKLLGNTPPGGKTLLGLMVQKLWRAQEYMRDRRGVDAAIAYSLDPASFRKHFGSYSAGQLFALLFDISFDEQLGYVEDYMDAEWDEDVLAVAKLVGVDFKKLAAAEAPAEKVKATNVEVKLDGVKLKIGKFKVSSTKPKKAKAKPAKKASKKKAA